MIKYGWRAVCAAILLVLAPGAGSAGDRHAGYYYPEPKTSEVYKARAQPVPEASRLLRIVFVTGLTNRMLKNPYPPDFAIFAKGAEAEKLIVVSLRSGAYDTLYRMRGLLAILTAVARSTPLFKGHPNQANLTFFDLASMMGFEMITVTDGRDFAHRIVIE